MKYYLLLAVMFLCAVLMACDGPAPPMDHAAVCKEENDGKSAAVDGYFFDDGHLFCSNIGGGPVTCGMQFNAKPGDEKGFTAYIPEGTWGNNIEKVGSSYKSSDIKIHDNSGNIISLADKVKISGKISVAPGNSACFLAVKKIEKQ